MILTGLEIAKQQRDGRISLSPFSAERISTNSYDLALGPTLIRYVDAVIDPRYPAKHVTSEIGPAGLTMRPGDFLLGHSVELIGSDHFVPIIHARSSIARIGLFVHITADLIDIGSHGQVTFQLFATLPVTIFSGMVIAQVSFWVPSGEITLYHGKYQNSQGPRASEIHRDFSRD